MKPTEALVALLVLCAASTHNDVAMATGPDKAAAETMKATDAAAEADLTPEERVEKSARQACKVDLCKALHSNDPSGGDIACHVIKSWRKEQLVKLVGKLKVRWPYDGVHCSMDLSVKRAGLVKAMTEAKTEIDFEKHVVTCVIASDKDAATEFKFELAPKVKFENGKATEAHANWGKIEAPALIKSAFWTATAADNAVDMLSSAIVDEVNDFVSKRCDEVKDQWAAKQ
jgi:hypothetical protein